ncbi:MAG: hypothetical protein ACRDQZ_00285, partial [Mycobacteriales bacterium]
MEGEIDPDLGIVPIYKEHDLPWPTNLPEEQDDTRALLNVIDLARTRAFDMWSRSLEQPLSPFSWRTNTP